MIKRVGLLGGVLTASAIVATAAVPASAGQLAPAIGSASTTGFFWVQPTPYPASSACAGNTDPRGCFYAGETVTLTVSYNTGSNRVYTTVADPANGDEYSASYQFSAAQALSTAHLGDIWLRTFPSGGTFVAPMRSTELGSFWGVTVTSNLV